MQFRALPITAACGVFFLLAVSCLVTRGQDRETRTFRDKSGKYEIEAVFVEYKNSLVALRREDGKVVRVKLSALSAEDQKYVRDELAALRAQPAQATRRPADVNAQTPQEEPNGTDWRGVDRTGVVEAKGLLPSWPADGPPLAWRSRGLGQGYASVNISGGMLYTMGRTQDGDSELIAVKIPGGEIAWRQLVRESDEPPNCTPVVDGQRVYALGFKGNLICCDAKSGKPIWRVEYARDFGGKMMSGWGYSESPLIDGDLLICTPGSPRAMMAALDKRTGRPVWTTPMSSNAGPGGTDGAGYSSPVVSNGGGVKQYIQLVGRGLIGVSAETGKLLWGYNRIANPTANVPTPLVSGDYVFCSTGYGEGGSALLKLSARGANVTAQEVYYLRNNETQNHHGGMVLLGDHIYMGEGHNKGLPLCLNWKTGRDAWRPGRGPGSGSAAVTCADGKLYFRYQNGIMALVDATPESYRLISQFRLASNNGSSWPHPLIHEGRLYIRDQDELLCYNIQATP